MRRNQIEDTLLGRNGSTAFVKLVGWAAAWIDEFDPEFRMSGARLFLDDEALVHCWLDVVQSGEGDRENVKLFDALVTHIQKEYIE